jgi:uncharacterized membrane protein
METTNASAARARGGDLVTPLAGLALLAGAILFLATSSGTYTILKSIHVIAAVVWVGGGLALIVLAILYDRRNDLDSLFSIARHAEWLGTRVFMPASFVTLGFGLATAANGNWDWGNAWIIIGLVGWAASAFVGIALITPRVKRLGAVTPDRYADPDVQARVREIMRIARIDSVILTLVVLDMVAKPFFG